MGMLLFPAAPFNFNQLATFRNKRGKTGNWEKTLGIIKTIPPLKLHIILKLHSAVGKSWA